MKRLVLLSFLLLVLGSFAKRPVLWVAIGDSITYLNDHQKETGNRITKGYMTMVTEKLPHIGFINQGHNGWTAARIADSIERLNLQKADVYSVFLGTNDWWQGRALGRLADYQNNTGNNTLYGSFRTIINKLKVLNKEAKIILITPMQRVDFVYIGNPKNNAYGSYREKNGQWLEAFAKAIDSIGAFEHLEVVDLYHKKSLALKKLVEYKRLKDPQTGSYKKYKYPLFIGIPFNPEADEYPYPPGATGMTYDGLHPSDKGYSVITRMLVRIMKKY